MAVTLYNLFEAALLCINAIAVLHEERFLAKGMHIDIICFTKGLKCFHFSMFMLLDVAILIISLSIT